MLAQLDRAVMFDYNAWENLKAMDTDTYTY